MQTGRAAAFALEVHCVSLGERVKRGLASYHVSGAALQPLEGDGYGTKRTLALSLLAGAFLLNPKVDVVVPGLFKYKSSVARGGELDVVLRICRHAELVTVGDNERVVFRSVPRDLCPRACNATEQRYQAKC